MRRREKDDEMRMSLRSNKKLPPIIEKALEGIEGYGGGHEYACGACVKKKNFKDAWKIQRLSDE